MSDIRFNRWLHQSGTGGVSQDSSGRVGIGSSVPRTTLDVVGVVSATSFNATGVSTFSGGLLVGTGASISSPATNVLTLGTNNAERIRISSNGAIGINSTSPRAILDVGGAIVVGRVDSSSEGGEITFCKSLDNSSAWSVDVYGSTSTPSLRFIDNTAGAARMSIDGSGRVTMPYQPHAEGGVTGLSNATPSSSTIITFNRVDVNIGNHYDTTNYRFNCPVTGNYLVKAHAQTNGQTTTTANTVNFNIRKNGSSISGVYESRYYGTSAPGYVKLEIIDVVYANAGDYLDIYAIISTTSLSLEYASPDIRWRFSYTLLG